MTPTATDSPPSKDLIIAQIAVPGPLNKLFDYTIPDALLGTAVPGQRALVEFGRQTLVGVIMALQATSDVPPLKLRALLQILDERPLISGAHLKFLQRVSEYYHYPIGEVVLGALAAPLRSDKPLPLLKPLSEKTVTAAKPLNDEQRTAVEALIKTLGAYHTTVLFGVTGSGKTQVYIETIAQVIERGEQALVLVPEIALTPQTVARFEDRFGHQVCSYHSKMTEKQRLVAWEQTRLGITRVMIGTRSSIFLPFARLGMIIVDEEHEASYKQQDGFKYCARDVAMLRASLSGIPVILGSATPSFTSLYNWEKNKVSMIELPHRAQGQASNQMILIDTSHKKLQSGLSAQLIEMMKGPLARGEQVLLFLNRRGFSPTLYCSNCQWNAACSSCDARLTYHQALNQLLCHHCNHRSAKPAKCPSCQEDTLCLLGQGTERLEETLTQLFPKEVVVRIDTDSTSKKGTLDQKLQMIRDREASIILGTQMLSKGHDFPGVTLAAIIDVDGGLYSADFRAIERMGQTIVQVAGRAGRSHLPGQVVLQTMQATHPLLATLLNEGYLPFAQAILKERADLGLPPYQHMAILSASAKTLAEAMAFLSLIKSQSSNAVQVLGPLPALMQKRLGVFRAGLILQSPQRGLLHPFLKQLTALLAQAKKPPRLLWDLDIDPHQML